MLEGTALLLSVLAVLSLIGISIYFYMDMDKHKVANATDIKMVKTGITQEKTDRLGNLAYVIDQVNVINKDIKKTYDEANTAQDVQVTNLGQKIDSVETGFGSILSVRSGTTASNIPLSSIASLTNPNIELIRNISTIGGMTIKNSTPTNQFKICGGTPEQCIQFPDSAGNIYMTGFGTSANITMASPVQFNNGLKIMRNGTNIGTIGVDTDNSSLSISSSNIYLRGDVNVTGNLKVNGTITPTVAGPKGEMGPAGSNADITALTAAVTAANTAKVAAEAAAARAVAAAGSGNVGMGTTLVTPFIGSYTVEKFENATYSVAAPRFYAAYGPM